MSDTVLAALERLNARLDTLEAKVDSLTYVAGRVPVMADAAAVMAGHAWAQAEADGIDPIALAEQGAALARKAARPEHLALVEKALDSAPLLEKALAQRALAEEALDQAELLRVALKIGRAVHEELDASGADLDVVAARTARLAARLAAATQSPEFEALLESGALEPATLGVVGEASRALVATQQAPAERLGLFATLKRMGDPDVQTAVGFALGIARRFGAALGGR